MWGVLQGFQYGVCMWFGFGSVFSDLASVLLHWAHSRHCVHNRCLFHQQVNNDHKLKNRGSISKTAIDLVTVKSLTNC